MVFNKQAKIEAEKMKKFRDLFKGLKFYLSREVPPPSPFGERGYKNKKTLQGILQ
jgi:hypothetical protein